ncbi:peroxiredoxin [soil metagenome]
MAATVALGDEAPDFALPATGGRTVGLAEHRGSPVVLVFYPGDDTPVCTRQLTSYNDDLAGFDGLGATLLGISPQGVASHEAFAAKHGLTMTLLADEDKEVGKAYGVLGPLGFYRRSVFVVDGGGTIRYAHRAVAGLTFKRSDELLEAVKAAS